MTPQIGDVWFYTENPWPPIHLLVLEYNKNSEVFSCLELETGIYSNWTMQVDLYPEIWRFVA